MVFDRQVVGESEFFINGQCESIINFSAYVDWQLTICCGIVYEARRA